MLNEKAPVVAGGAVNFELKPPNADGFDSPPPPAGPRRLARIITRCFSVDSPALKKIFNCFDIFWFV